MDTKKDEEVVDAKEVVEEEGKKEEDDAVQPEKVDGDDEEEKDEADDNKDSPPDDGTCFYTGCPKSHYTKVRAYCSACDHLICKIFLRMFQKSSSFEEFNGLSEIDVHFFE